VNDELTRLSEPALDDDQMMTAGARVAVAAIKRTLRWLAVATVVLALVLVGLVTYVLVNQETTHDALCNLRGDRIEEVAASRAFLDKHPEGLPQAGISAAVIQQGIERSQTTVDSLAPLGCADQV
jgi:hypothetical protein